jgi:uncharacterized repeat protein (TIGR01451 family)
MKNRTVNCLCAVLCVTLQFTSVKTFAQPKFPCDGVLRLTRQYPVGTNSYISQIDFGNNTITISNPGTMAGGRQVNASVYYNGYIWAQDWTNSGTNFTLSRTASDFTVTNFAVTGASAPPGGTNYNNAGVTKNGIMYIMQNVNAPVSIYAINLSSGTPVAVAGYPKTVAGLTAGNSVIWGDITVDPTTDRIYAWFHPSAASTDPRGLYEITNITTTPTLTKIGVASDITLGSLFFNDRGQLFGYGVNALTGNQDRFFAINKATGTYQQYGLPDIVVNQSDGCECAFRVSMDREVSIPVLNIARCAADTFSYTFTPRNYTTAAVTGITFRDTLDTRLSYVINTATLQTSLQAVYGGAVTVSLSNYSTGTNNLLVISNMSIPTGSNSFTCNVRVVANNFTSSTTISEQAFLTGLIPDLGGPDEPSNNPYTFNPKDATPITINLSGSRCQPPIADNFTNLPMPQTNGATLIPQPTGSDPDGTISTFTITLAPPATEGVLSYCSNGTNPCTGSNVTIAAGAGTTNLTPAQNATLKFDPTLGFTGTSLFNFTVTDNDGNLSNTAVYKLPVNGLPPVSSNIMENSMPNTNGPTAIKQLVSADPDGTIASWAITSLPTPAQGVLSIPCPPTPTTATCTGGFANLTAAVLTANAGSITLTATQMAGLRFDPTAAYIGNAVFNYNATDNSGNISNTANYTIPVTATATTLRPPLADNINAQPINNSLGNTPIPPLQGSDLDGTVVSYTIATIPPSVQGILKYCSNGSTPCTGSLITVTAGTTITPAQATSLQFDPDPTYVGTASFTYTDIDNSSLVSNTATYTIPVVNTPPTATNVNTTVNFNSIQAVIPAVGGSDKDGTVDTLRITSLPASGTLYLCNPTCAAVTVGLKILPADAAKLKFTPTTGFTGSVSFNYVSVDNNAQVSVPAIYTIKVANQPPVAADIVNVVMPNTNGSTAIASLSATDPDGTISSYTILTLPPPASGILTLCNPTCNAVTAGQVIAPADISKLQFDPAANYTDVVDFTYSATDNSGNISNVANYFIPISGVGNLPPVAQNIVNASMPNSNGSTLVNPLIGSDPDGTISNYTIKTIPPANQGTITYCSNGTNPCTGTVTPLTAGVVLTAAQMATLKYDPDPSFTGLLQFSYFDTDNSGSNSNIATYTIPVTGIPPIANPIVAPSMSNLNSSTAVPGLIATDADGTITNYTVETIPPASQGSLTYCSNGTAPCTGTVIAITPGTVLTAAQMGTLKFAPTAGYVGDVIFNYHATDNSSLLSNSTTYTIPVTGFPPLSKDIIAPKLLNSSSATAIPALNSNDPDGTVSSYTINSIPPASQGVLYYCSNGTLPCTGSLIAATVGLSLTPAQSSTLQFDPAAGFIGDVLFNYSSFDNSGNISNTATYLIPVGSSSTLPIVGLELRATLAGNTVNLQWLTHSENNTHYFVAERSTDNSSYTQTGNDVAAAGSSTIPRNYTLNDDISSLASQNIIYYRIRSVDIDGAVKYSNIATVRLGKKPGIEVWPNPVKDKVTIGITADRTSSVSIRLLDISGKQLQMTIYGVSAGNNQLNINLPGAMSAGVYLLEITDMTSKESNIIKLVKE